MAIGDTSTTESRERLAALTAKLASLGLPHINELVAALEAPPRVRSPAVWQLRDREGNTLRKTLRLDGRAHSRGPPAQRDMCQASQGRA